MLDRKEYKSEYNQTEMVYISLS